MGCYINPVDVTNVMWLEQNARFVCELDTADVPVYAGLCGKDKLPVVLVDNGPFYAAGVCFDEKEYKSFTTPDDPRPRTIYTCDKELLKSVVNSPEMYIK